MMARGAKCAVENSKDNGICRVPLLQQKNSAMRLMTKMNMKMTDLTDK